MRKISTSTAQLTDSHLPFRAVLYMKFCPPSGISRTSLSTHSRFLFPFTFSIIRTLKNWVHVGISASIDLFYVSPHNYDAILGVYIPLLTSFIYLAKLLYIQTTPSKNLFHSSFPQVVASNERYCLHAQGLFFVIFLFSLFSV